MKIVTLIARILLGLIFVVFGLNGFLNFLNMGPAPTGLAGQFLGALVLSHYYWVVAALQIAGGALLLVNRFVPLALVLLGPVIVNIICFHVFMNPIRSTTGGGRYSLVVDCFLSESPALFRNICVARVRTKLTEVTNRLDGCSREGIEENHVA